MAVFTLTLIRHGETNSNKERILQGQRDTVLSEKGQRQAELVGHRLQNEKFSHVFCSDLSRAIQTCENIMKRSKASCSQIVHDKRLRERGFGCYEGRPAADLQAAVKKAKTDFSVFVPPGGESLTQLRARAQDFFEEFCSKLQLLLDHGIDGPVGGKRRRNTSSVGSDVFPYPETTIEHQQLPDDGKEGPSVTGHANSGSTSSGCSSLAADSESPSDQSPDPSDHSQDAEATAPLTPDLPTSDISLSQESSGSSLSEDGEYIFCPVVDSDIRSTITPPRGGVQYGYPNVSLSPIFEHRLHSISSVSSGRNNSFDDGDVVPSFLAEVLIVAHGGLLKELVGYFIDELGCTVPGGKKNALQVSPNTGISKFTVTLASHGELPKVTCLTIHDKDHLIDEAQALQKPVEFYA